MKSIGIAILTTFLSLFWQVSLAQTESTSTTTTTTVPADAAGNPMPGPTTTYTTTTATTVDSTKDDDIVTNVYARYAKDPALIGTSLTVSAKNGIVTINGTVTAQSQADAAVEAAKSVPNVKDVRSAINVTTNPNLNVRVQTPNY